MTSCKRIDSKHKKDTVFEVEFEIEDDNRDNLVDSLKGVGWNCLEQLADIIEKG